MACPSNERHLAALAEIAAAGIRASAPITRMPPREDPERFARRLAALGSATYVAQPCKPVAGTRRMANETARELGWTAAICRAAVVILRNHLLHLYEGREGFPPE